MLMEAVLDYMGWVKSMEKAGGSPGAIRYTRILTDFLIYVIHKGMAWENMFTLSTVEAFRSYSGYKGAFPALRVLNEIPQIKDCISPLRIENGFTRFTDLN